MNGNKGGLPVALCFLLRLTSNYGLTMNDDGDSGITFIKKDDLPVSH